MSIEAARRYLYQADMRKEVFTRGFLWGWSVGFASAVALAVIMKGM